MRVSVFSAQLLLGALVCAILTLSGCDRGASEESQLSPDIVLVTFDTLRADALGSYREGASLTPRIDSFAVDSVLFENAITPIGTTFPAHASLFTGLYPRMHGVRWNGDSLAPEHQTLAELLSESGYNTAAFVAVPTMLGHGGLGQGFASTLEVPGADIEVQPGAEVTSQALEWLAGTDTDRPLLLWTHYFEAHTPHKPGPWARKRFGSMGYKGPLRAGASVERFYSLGEDQPLSEEDSAALRVLYDEEVVLLDGYFGQLLDALEKRESPRPLLVVLTADHGQSLGEHNSFGHGFLLWQPVLHVPLMIGGDAVPSPGHRVPTRVSLLDLQPTILEMAGMETQESTFGRSLKRALSGASLDERTLLAEVRVLAENKRHTRDDAAAVAVFDGSSKLIWRPDGFEIFNLDEDPDEIAGVTTLEEDRWQRMLERAEAFTRDVETVTNWKDLDADTLEQLRALGYLD